MKQIFTLTVFIALLGITSSVHAQDFQTGSDMMCSGSTYSSSVSSVGADNVSSMATTTYSDRVLRRDDSDEDEEVTKGDPNDFTPIDTPIGEPFILLFFAAVAAVAVALRIRKEQVSNMTK